MRHERVNEWFEKNAPKFGLPARGVVFRTDTALAADLKRPGGLEKRLQAAMLATWTRHERSRDEIVSGCLERLKQMYAGTGGHLRVTAHLLHDVLKVHPDPDRIVLDVRLRLPARQSSPITPIQRTPNGRAGPTTAARSGAKSGPRT